jgi:hypothetical protein
MTVTQELVERPTPLETLTLIGFTRNEANAFLGRIENSFTPPIKVFRYRKEQRNFLNYRKFLTVVWGYALMVWAYVVAMQLRFPESVYWRLALWLPIRMDYLGEIAFVSSFILACGIAIGNARSTPPHLLATASN